MTSKYLLGISAFLLIVPAFSCHTTDSSRTTAYSVQLMCEGGGGNRNCKAKNTSAEKFGPFDLELEFADQRGVRLERTTVTNNQGLEPNDEWEFKLVVPTETRSVRLLRVVPR